MIGVELSLCAEFKVNSRYLQPLCCSEWLKSPEFAETALSMKLNIRSPLNSKNYQEHFVKLAGPHRHVRKRFNKGLLIVRENSENPSESLNQRMLPVSLLVCYVQMSINPSFD